MILSKHAVERLHERTKLRISDFLRLFKSNSYYLIGFDKKEPHLYHYLFYSHPDTQPYIAVINSRNDVVVSILYFDYQQFSIDPDLIYNLKYKKNTETETNTNKKNIEYNKTDLIHIKDLKKSDRLYKILYLFFKKIQENNKQHDMVLLYGVLNIFSNFIYLDVIDDNINQLPPEKVLNKITDYFKKPFLVYPYLVGKSYKINNLNLNHQDKLFYFDLIVKNIDINDEPNFINNLASLIFYNEKKTDLNYLAFENLFLNKQFDLQGDFGKKPHKAIHNIISNETPIKKYCENLPVFTSINILKTQSNNKGLMTLFRNHMKSDVISNQLIIYTEKQKISIDIPLTAENQHKKNDDHIYDFLNTPRARILNISKQDILKTEMIDYFQ